MFANSSRKRSTACNIARAKDLERAKNVHPWHHCGRGDLLTGVVASMASRSVSEIEGIGPSTATRLEAIGVHTTDDLSRGSAAQIHAGVRDVASLDNVRAWRSMARLLNVDGMTAQWAEALQKAGVDRMSALHTKTVDELTAIFADAQANGVIPDTPDASVCFRLIRDALEIDLTGMLVGTVVDAQSQAVAGATVRVGTKTAATDARGRFRVVRIPLGVSFRLIVSHDAWRTLEVEDPPILPYEDRLEKVTYTLLARALNEPSRRLDEFDGDVLPRLTAYSMRSVRRDLGELRDGDVFVLHKQFARTPDALLASLFWAYASGEFLIWTYKVPLADLPPNPRVRACFIHENGAFSPFPASTSRMEMMRNLRRVRKMMAGRPPATTLVEIDNRMREHAQLMRNILSE